MRRHSSLSVDIRPTRKATYALSKHASIKRKHGQRTKEAGMKRKTCFLEDGCRLSDSFATQGVNGIAHFSKKTKVITLSPSTVVVNNLISRNFSEDVISFMRAAAENCEDCEISKANTSSESTMPRIMDSFCSIADGDYKFTTTEILVSESSSYRAMEYLGRGSFGRVVKCLKEGTDEIVAVKALKDNAETLGHASREVDMLRRLNEENAAEFHIVRMFEDFEYYGHTFLVFEVLQQDLNTYLKENGPLPLDCISLILQQLMTAFRKLKELHVIHADVKLDNVMLANARGQPLNVKLIDFGLAIEAPEPVTVQHVQHKFYRAPEVVLGIPATCAIDMWALGCMAANMFLNYHLYPAKSEYDLLRYIQDTHGPFPQNVLDAASRTENFFLKKINENNQFWTLKSPDDYKRETGVEPKEHRTRILTSLSCIAVINVPKEPNPYLSIMRERFDFVDLLKRMLSVDPDNRITPEEALREKFLET